KRVCLAKTERYLCEVSRSKTGRRKSADHVWPALKVVEHAQTFAAPAGGITALGAAQTYTGRKNLIIEPRIEGRFDKSHIAAGASTVFLELDDQAVSRTLVVV